MDNKIKKLIELLMSFDELLECLIDEVMDSKDPSERTLDVLEKHKGNKIVDDYFKWLEEENERF